MFLVRRHFVNFSVAAHLGDPLRVITFIHAWKLLWFALYFHHLGLFMNFHYTFFLSPFYLRVLILEVRNSLQVGKTSTGGLRVIFLHASHLQAGRDLVACCWNFQDGCQRKCVGRTRQYSRSFCLLTDLWHKAVGLVQDYKVELDIKQTGLHQ